MIRNFHGDHPSDEDLTWRCGKAGRAKEDRTSLQKIQRSTGFMRNIWGKNGQI
jgi:hypothetical protein